MLYVSYKFTTGPTIGRKMLKITFKSLFLRQDLKMSEEHHLLAHGSIQLSPTFLVGTWIVMAACVKFQESLLALTLFVMECRLRDTLILQIRYNWSLNLKALLETTGFEHLWTSPSQIDFIINTQTMLDRLQSKLRVADFDRATKSNSLQYLADLQEEQRITSYLHLGIKKYGSSHSFD
jgi:hypothetical protein